MREGQFSNEGGCDNYLFVSKETEEPFHLHTIKKNQSWMDHRFKGERQNNKFLGYR